LDIDSATEVDLDQSVAADSNNSENAGSKSREKQLVSEVASSGEDNTNDL